MKGKFGKALLLLLVYLSVFACRFVKSSTGVNDKVRLKDGALLHPMMEMDSSYSAIKNWPIPMVELFLGKLNFDDEAELDELFYFDDDSAELVIGLDKRLDSFSKVEELISRSGGELVDTVVMNNEVRAVVADMPYKTMSAFLSEIEVSGFSRYIEPNIMFKVDFTPNDPDWPLQWGPSVIEADYAWNTTIGDPSLLVAVIDTGVDWDHPDLVGNYVPLGYDWVNNDTDPMDDHGHGTHCAGIIGATINNSIGIAGLAQVQIMAEKGLGAEGIGKTSDLANGIIHAVDQGADILSCSWGNYISSTLKHEAVKYAYNHSVLIIGAAGNSRTYRKHYPSGYPEVVSVTATDESDIPAWFTNFGNHVEVAAPGVQVYSTIWDNSYDNKSGTSMAAPHAAGVAALIWSQFPNMTRDQVRTQLRYTADDLGYSGFDPYYGYGRVNARRAVERGPLDHDLLISHLETLPCRLGSSSLINITLFNFGIENESDLTVQLIANGSIVNSTSISSLATMESVTVSFSWAPTVEGVHNVTSYVVPQLDETALDNNALSASVSVRTSRVFRVPTEYPTIQSAINVAWSGFGDTIEVAAGTYYEHITIYQSVTVVGEDRSTTIIYGNENETVVSIPRGLLLRSRVYSLMKGFNFSRFTIQGGLGTGSGLRVYTYGNISDNIITNNSYGMYLYGGGCTLRHNNITGNIVNFDVYGSSLIHLTHDIDVSNMVNGKPIYYLVNEHDEQIPSDAGYVAAVNSSNISATDLTLTNNGQAVLFAHTINSVIRNVTISNNDWGILLLENSDNNTIAGNRICHNAYGLYIESSNNDVSGNNVTDNYESISLSLHGSSNNAISENHVANNDRGINIFHSSNNAIFRNTITNNMIGGIGLTFSSFNTIYENDVSNGIYGILWDEYSSNNSIYHNNFFNPQVFVWRDGDNTWDNGCEGNYWSDYSGVDSDGDGIGDTPYTIEGSHIDRYPLMNLYWNPGDINHDLVVDIHDVVTVVTSYSTTPLDDNWNCHCDINEPYGKIDIFDVVLMCNNYEEEYSL